MDRRRLRLLSANIQAGSSTRGYHDYVARSWSHVLPAGNKRGALDAIAHAGGGSVEGYPRHDLDTKKMSASFLFNGTLHMFERAGFERVADLAKFRCIVRRTVAQAH